MKDILIVANFVSFSWEKGNSRFIYLADMLSDKGAKVELVTSSFWHSGKTQRDIADDRFALSKYKITLLDEPGYPKNVCLSRLRSHKKFAVNLREYLAKRKRPDIIYCAVPSLNAGNVLSEYCKKNKVPFIIDIQDLWPEAFQMVFNIPILSNMIFSPMKRKADKIYSSADAIVAVSDTYIDRGMKVNSKCKNAVVYLGTDKEHFDLCASKDISKIDWVNEGVDRVATEIEKNTESKIRLAYAGTLGSSYDISLVFDSLRLLNKSLSDRLEFVVMGDGPNRKRLESEAKDLPVIFTGPLPYDQMVWILKRCDIAVNPIVKGAAQSIINKHMDYAMSGLPVINTQESKEYRSLLEAYSCGINCECGNARGVCDALEILVNNSEKRIIMGQGSRKMGEELFDRPVGYGRIIGIIKSFLGEPINEL